MMIKKYVIKTWSSLHLIKQYYLSNLYHRIGLHHDLLLAGGLSFSFFICIIPLVLIVFSLLGYLLENVTLQGQIESSIRTIIPYSEAANYVKTILFSRFEEVRSLKNVAGYLGVVGLFFAASGLFTSMRTILNIIFYSEKDVHSVVGKMRDLGMIVLIMLFFLFTMAILPLFELTINLASQVPIFKFFQFDFFYDLLLSLGSFSLIMLFFACIYFLIPHARLHKKVVLLSSFCAALFWEIAKKIFGIYLAHFTSFNRIYGAYVFIIVVAFWIYYSSMIFIISAEVGQIYRERTQMMGSNR